MALCADVKHVLKYFNLLVDASRSVELQLEVSRRSHSTVKVPAGMVNDVAATPDLHSFILSVESASMVAFRGARP